MSKEIKQKSVQWIFLEGFGELTISEAEDGAWHIDLFPPRSRNNGEFLRIQTQFNADSGKSFEYIKDVLSPLQQNEDK